ncbi:mechanosensitive ion channel family protein [Atopococcus tabaci]|uniref:mechanosensitive ion channel family protein n=1 Tax=Atopococcus tabaci TaxID=269774 RepID=UPI00040034C7|nr:mechanosensitive ion channel family protein [Atopococcus tabaci]
MESIREFLTSYPLLVNLFWIALIATILYFLRKTVLNRLYPHMRESSSWYAVRKIATWISNTIIVLFVVYAFGDNLRGFSTTLGLAGAGITYALREVIVSFAGWFAIMFGDFFKTGDRVLLGGIKGDVVDIGLLRTTLMEMGEWVNGDQYTGRIVRVANSYIFNSPVYNYTAYFNFLWDEIHIPIRFGSDVKLAKTLVMETAEEIIDQYDEEADLQWRNMRRRYRLENASIEPQVFVSFDDNWIEVSLRYIVKNKRRRGTRDELFSRLLKKFEEAGDSIQLASETIEVVRSQTLQTDEDNQ